MQSIREVYKVGKGPSSSHTMGPERAAKKFRALYPETDAYEVNLSYFLSDTQRVSFDIVVRSMYETGISMNQRFRETSEGGLAKMFNRRRC